MFKNLFVISLFTLSFHTSAITLEDKQAFCEMKAVNFETAIMDYIKQRDLTGPQGVFTAINQLEKLFKNNKTYQNFKDPEIMDMDISSLSDDMLLLHTKGVKPIQGDTTSVDTFLQNHYIESGNSIITNPNSPDKKQIKEVFISYLMGLIKDVPKDQQLKLLEDTIIGQTKYNQDEIGFLSTTPISIETIEEHSGIDNLANSDFIVHLSYERANKDSLSAFLVKVIKDGKELSFFSIKDLGLSLNNECNYLFKSTQNFDPIFGSTVIKYQTRGNKEVTEIERAAIESKTHIIYPPAKTQNSEATIE